jgi:hypothetical protein
MRLRSGAKVEGQVELPFLSDVPFRSPGLPPYAEPRLLVLLGLALFAFMLVRSMGRILKMLIVIREGLSFGRDFKVICLN